MDAFVPKPVEPARLVEIIEQLAAAPTGCESVTKIPKHPKFGGGGVGERRVELGRKTSGGPVAMTSLDAID